MNFFKRLFSRNIIEKEKLSYDDRKKLPSSAFVFPEERKYPIHDLEHARNALARGVQQYNNGNLSKSDLKKIVFAVQSKYPSIKISKELAKIVGIKLEEKQLSFSKDIMRKDYTYSLSSGKIINKIVKRIMSRIRTTDWNDLYHIFLVTVEQVLKDSGMEFVEWVGKESDYSEDGKLICEDIDEIETYIVFPMCCEIVVKDKLTFSRTKKYVEIHKSMPDVFGFIKDVKNIIDSARPLTDEEIEFLKNVDEKINTTDVLITDDGKVIFSDFINKNWEKYFPNFKSDSKVYFSCYYNGKSKFSLYIREMKGI